MKIISLKASVYRVFISVSASKDNNEKIHASLANVNPNKDTQVEACCHFGNRLILNKIV